MNGIWKRVRGSSSRRRGRRSSPSALIVGVDPGTLAGGLGPGLGARGLTGCGCVFTRRMCTLPGSGDD